MLDSAYRLLKISLAIAIGALFMAALSTLISLSTTILFGGVISEVLSIISCCLPFDAYSVFLALGNVSVSILAFLVARKIFELTSWSNSTT